VLKVIEVANLLGVSKVTIYKKMEKFKKELKPHLHKKRNITYVDDDGVEIIRQSLIENNVIFEKTDIENQVKELSAQLEKKEEQLNWINNQLMTAYRDDILNLRFVLDLLNGQIKVKSSQLIEKEEMLSNYKDINRLNKERIENFKKILETQ
jgi:lipopolysaccharide biosynthesis regulator YciM